jgi:hypothetical protein
MSLYGYARVSTLDQDLGCRCRSGLRCGGFTPAIGRRSGVCGSSALPACARDAAGPIVSPSVVCPTDDGSMPLNTPGAMAAAGRRAGPISERVQIRQTRVVLAAAHLDHDPRNNRALNLRSRCQRCHMIHDRPHHLAQRRITYLLRRALGDLFLGPYSVYFGLQPTGVPRPSGGTCLA